MGKKPSYEELETRVKELEKEVARRKRTEEDLRVRESEFRLLYKRAPLGFQSLDENGYFIDVNETWLETLGYSREEVVGKSFGDFLHPDFVDHFKENFPRFKAVGQILGIEFEMVKKDGSIIIVSFNGKIVRDEKGQFQKTHCILTDITQRKQAEVALGQSEERLELALKGADLGLWDWNIQTGELIVNQRCTEMLGYSLDEIEPHVRSQEELIHPDDRLRVTELVKAHLEGETPLYEAEHRLRTKSGEWNWILTRGKVSEWDETGRPLRATGTNLDITKRKQAEEELRKSERLYRNLLNNLNAGVVAHAPDTSVLTCNPKALEILGLTYDQMIGKTAIDPQWRFFREDGTEMPAEEYPVNRVLSTTSTLHNLIVGINRPDKDGVVWALVNGFPVFKDGGELEQIIIDFIDITDIKQAEEENKKLEERFRQSQRMEAIGRLAGGVSHDFNNLLTAITAYAELLSLGLGRHDPLHHNVEEIRKAVERATTLTSQLLAFSHKQVFQPKVLDLNAVIVDMENMLRRLIGEDIELVTLLGSDRGHIKADPGQIEQIIMNVVVNARDAMVQGGKLTLETANVKLDKDYVHEHLDVQPGSYVMFSVSDTGEGMDAYTKDHIFEPFFSTKEKDKGTGLGLATVYGIVKQSEGHIWVYSEPEHGTTFKIYLPQVDLVPEPAEQNRVPVSSESLGGSETILLVEDEEGVRGAVREILQRSGYKVLEAPSPGEALLISEEHTGLIHLMLTDVVMPRMSGPELAQRLKSWHPEMKVLYVSGYTDNAIVHHGVLDPGLAFLSKPFSMENLLQRVRQLLDSPKQGEAMRRR